MSPETALPPALRALLDDWEKVTHRSALRLWVLLALSEAPAYGLALPARIRALSGGAFSVEAKSVYRALAQLQAADALSSECHPSPEGPARRFYSLTPAGQQLLAAYVRRHLHPLIAGPARMLVARAAGA